MTGLASSAGVHLSSTAGAWELGMWEHGQQLPVLLLPLKGGGDVLLPPSGEGLDVVQPRCGQGPWFGPSTERVLSTGVDTFECWGSTLLKKKKKTF